MARRIVAMVVFGMFGLSTGAPLRAAAKPEAFVPVTGKAERFAVTPRLDAMTRAARLAASAGIAGNAVPQRDRQIPNPPIMPDVPVSALTGAASRQRAGTAVRSFSATGLMPAPAVTFEGLSNQDNFAAQGFRVSPPDTNGDVGPNHYVQMTNLLVRVFDKAGTPVTPPFKLSTLFSAVGGPCANRDDGDPIVLYDPLADRWMLSQFCTVADPNTHQMIAISQTPDPAGAYFVYDFRMPNNLFNDYPHFGVWPDAYYMTDNQFGAGNPTTGAFAFDRARMLAGDPTAGFIYFNLAGIKGGMLPADLDGLNPPPAGAPAYFAQFLSALSGENVDGLRLFQFHADFENPGASTFAFRPESPLPVDAFDPRTPAGRNDIEQPAPGVLVDAIADRLMFRVAYRNFGGHESLIASHTVNVGTGTTADVHQAGVRYYELRRALPSGSFVVHEQGTHAPDGDNRWMGSAAQDAQGNIAVGYSVSSLSTFPAVRYAGRLATDPPGGLFQAEASLAEGSGVQVTSPRWGDYSSMSVDPADDCTFWYTTEYYTAASQLASGIGWLTRIGSFRFPSCTAPARGTIEGTVTDAVTGLPVQGATIAVAGSASATTDAAGRYSVARAPGTYVVSVSRPSYHPASQSGVVVTDGGTTTVNFSITPRVATQVAILVGDGQTGIAGLPLPIRPTVVVRDAENQAVAGVSVTFAVAGGGGSIEGPATQVTNLLGQATVGWTLGSAAGPNTLTVTTTPPLAGSPVTFTATAVVLNVSINDISVTEGNAGSTNAVFTVGLSSPVPASQSASVRFQTADGTATTNPLTFGNSTTISIPAVGNGTPYPSVVTVPPLPITPRKVTVTLSLTHTFPSDIDMLLVGPGGQSVVLMSDAGGGTAVSSQQLTFDDAGAPLPSAIVSGVYRPTDITLGLPDVYPAPAPAPPYGTTLAAFAGINPSGDWRLFVLDDEAPDSGSIVSGWTLNLILGDYTSTSGTLTFTPGSTTRTFTVPVIGDVEPEADETFFANLSAPVNVLLPDPQGQATIVNDDALTAPVASINNVTVTEGNSGTTNAVFTVSLFGTSASTVTVDYATANGSAQAGADYSARSGTLTFPPGTPSQAITVPVVGDPLNEPNETFFVTLTNPVNAVLGTPIGQATIVNDDAAAVSGAVTDAATGLPISGVTVSLVNSGGATVASVVTGASGAWTLTNQNPGSYVVRTTNTLGYVDEMYNDLPCVPCLPGNGTPVVLTGGSTTSGINFALALGGRITGRVTQAGTTAGISGVGVQFYNAAGSSIGIRTTDSTGAYSILGLPTGSYRLRTLNSSGFIDELYDDIVCLGCNVTSGTAVPVTAPATTAGIDFALAVGGRVSGTITDANTGAPLSGIFVQVFTAAGTPVNVSTSTNASGVYTSVGLPSGTYFARTTNTGLYLPELYDNIACPFECAITSGTPIIVTTGATTPGIDFGLLQGGRISGTVTDAATGLSVTGGVVDVHDSSGTYLTTASASSGTFTTSALPVPGPYFLRTRNSGGYIDELYDNIECVLCPVTTGTPVSVATGVVTTGINIGLARGARISGIVTDAATGAPLSGVSVQVRRLDGVVITSSSTNAAGTYLSPTGLPTGSYLVRTSSLQGYVNKVWDNIVCVGCPPTTGTPLAVTAPLTTTGINFALAAGGRISGSLTNETTGLPIVGASVGVYTAAGDFVSSSTTNASGSYLSSAGLTTGTYFVRSTNASQQGYTDELYDDIVCPAPCAAVTSGTPVAVTQPNVTSGINLALFRGPAVSIGDATVTEGTGGTVDAVFTVTLTAASAAPVTVTVETANGTAAAGADFTATTTTLTFAPGTTSQTFTVSVNGDAIDEPDETFLAVLSSASGAKIVRSQGTGTILDDDEPPSIAIGDVSISEGDAGTTNATFTLTLSAASGRAISVTAATADGSATAGSDYTAVSAAVTFAPGVTSQALTVPILGDTLNEADETFTVTLSAPVNATLGSASATGTILNDDPQPSLSMGSTAVSEGNSGTTNATFTVTLSAASGQTVSVTATTADDSARAGSDYNATSVVLTFAPGVRTQMVTVPVVGDTVNEAEELFTVNLSAAVNATIAGARGIGVIFDDDAADLRPVADAYVRSGRFRDTNFGSATQLQVKQSRDSDLSRRSFLRFDLRGVTIRRVSRAELRVFVRSVDGPPSRFKAFAVASDTWREDRITWDNQPSTGAVLGSTTVTGAGWVTFDVTAFVNAQLGGDHQASFALRDDTLAEALVRLDSRESSVNKPALVLVP